MVVERSVQLMRSGHHGSHMQFSGRSGRRGVMKREIKEQAEEGKWGRVVEKRSPRSGCRGEYQAVADRSTAACPMFLLQQVMPR